MEILSICVSDIPKDLIKKADNGKLYMNICVSEMKQKDKFDNTHTVFMGQTKEQREAKVDKIYIGNGYSVTFNEKPVTSEDINSFPPAPSGDLPWE